MAGILSFCIGDSLDMSGCSPSGIEPCSLCGRSDVPIGFFLPNGCSSGKGPPGLGSWRTLRRQKGRAEARVRSKALQTCGKPEQSASVLPTGVGTAKDDPELAGADINISGGLSGDEFLPGDSGTVLVPEPEVMEPNRQSSLVTTSSLHRRSNNIPEPNRHSSFFDISSLSTACAGTSGLKRQNCTIEPNRHSSNTSGNKLDPEVETISETNRHEGSSGCSIRAFNGSVAQYMATQAMLTQYGVDRLALMQCSDKGFALFLPRSWWSKQQCIDEVGFSHLLQISHFFETRCQSITMKQLWCTIGIKYKLLNEQVVQQFHIMQSRGYIALQNDSELVQCRSKLLNRVFR